MRLSTLRPFRTHALLTAAVAALVVVPLVGEDDGPVPCGTGTGPHWGGWAHARTERRVEFSFSKSLQACETDPERIRLRITNRNAEPVRVSYTLRLVSGIGKVVTYSGALRVAPGQTLDRDDWRPFPGTVGADDPLEVRIRSYSVSHARVCSVHDIPDDAGVGGAAYVPACDADRRREQEGRDQDARPDDREAAESEGAVVPGAGESAPGDSARLFRRSSPSTHLTSGLVAPVGGGWAERYCRRPAANTFFGPGPLARARTEADAIERCESTSGLECAILRLPEGARPAC